MPINGAYEERQASELASLIRDGDFSEKPGGDKSDDDFHEDSPAHNKVSVSQVIERSKSYSKKSSDKRPQPEYREDSEAPSSFGDDKVLNDMDLDLEEEKFSKQLYTPAH